jgi:hypothetical protein
MVGMDWWMFGLCLLLPDLAALGYLINWWVGNVSYHIADTLAIPLVIGGIALVIGSELGQQVVLIWLAHIGMDRMVGDSFKQGNPFEEHRAR